ncbi:MAG: hypothetical protein KDI47_16690 [Gammaproteobacteria bacterium]|nr:hypothetical protein [Gammaproteobacteria bacterium]
MAFVNERIPEEEKEKFTFEVFTHPDGEKPTLYKWTVDRQKNAFLVLTKVIGGGASGTQETEYFTLIWNQHLIKFSADAITGGSRETGYFLTWNVHQVEIPQEIQDMREDIQTLIRDALDAKGLFYRRNFLTEVNVVF